VKYGVELLPEVERALKKMDPQVRRRVFKAIEGLADNPRPAGAKALEGADRLYRVRAGDWRVVYRIRDRDLLVLVIRAGHRREIYKGRK
jgi:mRNA interferase RelE/StbE